jgi:hypothetical protein
MNTPHPVQEGLLKIYRYLIIKSIRCFVGSYYHAVFSIIIVHKAYTINIPVRINVTNGKMVKAPYPIDIDEAYKLKAIEIPPSKIILIGSVKNNKTIKNSIRTHIKIIIINCECSVVTVNEPITSEVFEELYNFIWCFSSGRISVK